VFSSGLIGKYVIANLLRTIVKPKWSSGFSSIYSAEGFIAFERVDLCPFFVPFVVIPKSYESCYKMSTTTTKAKNIQWYNLGYSGTVCQWKCRSEVEKL
jgi:hypothetical protein